MDSDQVFRTILNGEAVLFLGAGYSAGTENLKGSPMKTGGQLAEYFSKAVGFPVDTNLAIAADEFEHQFGQDKLIRELRDEFTAKEIKDYQRLTASLDWKRIYTTNYDNIFEAAARENSKRAMAVTPRMSVAEINMSELLCVHMNGYIGSLTRETLHSDFKLTETNYLTSSISETPWASVFRQDISLAQLIVFIGYSLADLDISRMLAQNSRLKSKSVFVLGKRVSKALRSRVSRIGELLDLDAEEFINGLDEFSQSYDKPSVQGPLAYSVAKFEKPKEAIEPKDEDIFSLLLLGDFRDPLFASDVNTDQRYTVFRRKSDIVLNALDNFEKVIAVHSDLGNGKTIFINQLRHLLIEKGFEVHNLENRSLETLAEVESYCRSTLKRVLIVEDYQQWWDVLEFLGLQSPNNVQVVCTARSAIHDVVYQRLLNYFDRESLVEVNVDRLISSELDDLAKFLDHYGLWGDKASFSTDRKLSYLKDRTNSEFHAVLLDLFQSPQILGRFEVLLNAFINNREYSEILIGILVLTVLNFQANVNNLVDIFGSAVLESNFRNKPEVKQLVDFDENRVRMRSSVAAGYLLQKSFDPNLIVHVLYKMSSVADRNSRNLIEYKNLLRGLTVFSNVQFLLPEKGRRRSVISYYERIKSLDGLKTSPLFWLQYAIACLVFEEFERSGVYFDSAYSFAGKLGTSFDTYQIDNHHARWLLMNAMHLGPSGNYMTAFREAHRKINRQIQDSDREHYPYRVASNYEAFFSKFESHMTENEKREIAVAARHVLNKISQLDETLRKQRYIADCAEHMESLVLRVDYSETD